MAITEIFNNPSVKQVIFQVRFPNLFYIENRIGDFQIKIMERFPESAILFRQQILFADIGPNIKFEDLPSDVNRESNKKIWQFKSKDGVVLNLLTDSLDITSTLHKTYNNKGSDNKFRDIIRFVLDSFLEITKLPVFLRIGLRYIDECPIFEKSNDVFLNSFNSAFNLNRFNLAEAIQMEFTTVVKKDKYLLRYYEAVKQIERENKLILDFDGSGNDIETGSYLTTLDQLHDIISAEYENTLKEPIYKFMRNK
jgi:uncharacterized protein (TIGR04255 family)